MSALTPAATPAEAAKAAAEIPGLQPSHAETAAPGPTSQPAAVSATAAGSANTTAGATDVSAQAASTPATEASPDMGAPSAALPVAGGAATTDAADTSSMIKVVATAPHPAEGGDGAFPVNSPAVDNEEDDGQAAEGTEDHGQPISKNQLKKRAKLQRRLEIKAMKKAQEKQKKAEVQARKKAEGAARLAAMTPDELAAHTAARRAHLEERRLAEQQKHARLKQALESGQRVVIDLDFEGCMTETEVHSMAHQLQHCYAANNQAAVPCHLYLTGVTGQIKQAIQRQLAGFENWQVTASDKPYMDLFGSEQQRTHLVYLTADSEQELGELAPEDILIIGGLVDRNRHKNICFNRAKNQGIRTAQLPIGKLLQVTGSVVLTVNQVVEILLEYNTQRDWKAAFLKVVPQRKRAAADDAASDQPATKQPRTDAEEVPPAEHSQPAGQEQHA
eukprot:CAMPEP_0206144746 /NCGR_PEP_ID=MMETSP1473-20131121/25139_1 /ASSEMBLY_ACC=CAM_ASM_001109 /TAXON_ID=1461547 /ORGANISM="Stichococcus sp, Strain RCC1054" /LENGTH=446 /DNA_ID=CAMNT_0053540675 /DNA_START=271 /DNA_END=1611 /DNA_ORIENTATION=+